MVPWALPRVVSLVYDCQKGGGAGQELMFLLPLGRLSRKICSGAGVAASGFSIV